MPNGEPRTMGPPRSPRGNGPTSGPTSRVGPLRPSAKPRPRAATPLRAAVELDHDEGAQAEIPETEEAAAAPKARGRREKSHGPTPSEIKRKEQKALTGCRSDFGCLAMGWSEDPTLNVRAALASRLMAYKWRMFVKMALIRQAHLLESVKHKRNPRWLARSLGKEMAWVWGHAGSAVQYLRQPPAEVLHR